MSLRIVYGRSGSGKSTYLYEEIAKEIGEPGKIYIITPEQFSFTSEKKLLQKIQERTGKEAVLEAEVLTFGRMAYRVMNEVGGIAKTTLSSCGKAMLIYHILSEKKKELKFLGKSEENIDTVLTQITELKKHGISKEQLKQIQEEEQDLYLKAKLNDIHMIYEVFQETIQNQYIDENDHLTILSELLDHTTMFQNTRIYLDEFVGFTTQEYEILEKLLKQAKRVTITVCSDEIQEGKNPDTDIFYSNKQTISRIYDVAKRIGITIEGPIELKKIERFKSPELIHIEQNLYTVPYHIYQEKVQNLSIFLAKNQYSEIEKIAGTIVKLVREEGYRYQDIAVITKNLETYSNLCKVIFAQYEVPAFIDEKKELSQNILVKYLLSVLEIYAKNWSYESVFHYLKCGFSQIDDQELYTLENYCLKWGIKGSKWYTKEWNFHDENSENQEELKRIRELRKKVVDPLMILKKKLVGIKTAKQMTEEMYHFLIENKVDQILKGKIKRLTQEGKLELAAEIETSWKIIMQILDEIVLVFGEARMGFEAYRQILKTGLGNSSLGKIPMTQDQVIIGDIDRSRSHKMKAVFMIGLNDGMFPQVNKNEGFLDDKDRGKLKEKGIELAKGTIERIYEDNFNIYKAFTTAEQKLYLSYASSDSEGKSLRASVLITKIKKMFPEIHETSDVIKKESEIITKQETFEMLIENLRAFRDGEEIGSIWFHIYEYYRNDEKWNHKLQAALQALQYTNLPEKIKQENIEKLYGNTLKTSVSKLEQYQSCAFSYYLKYGLKLSEKNTFEIQPVDTGSFMHEVIDEFFEKVQERELNIKTIEQEQIETIIQEIIGEKLQLNKNYIFTSNAKYRNLAARLTRVITKSMKYIIESLKQSEFEVLGHEIEFKEGKQYKPIMIEAQNGKKIEIIGKIDRIDIAKSKEGNYIRIIDYKSAIKNINLNEVVAGLQIQLLTYLDATCKLEDFLPAGILYYNLIDPMIKSDHHLTTEELEKEIKKKFKMNGLILADVDVIKKMDTKLETGASDIIPAYLNKEGEVSSSKSNSVTKEQFEYLQVYTNKIIKQIGEAILTGDIRLRPYYNMKNKKTPCEYCKYHSICNFHSRKLRK